MKKWLWAFLCALLLLCAAQTALAAEAVDITDQCKFKTCYTAYKYSQMTDKKFTTYWDSKKVKNPYVILTSPEDQLIAGVYVCFGGTVPSSWEVQTSDNGKDWFKAADGLPYLHSYVALPEPSRYVRVIVTTGKQMTLRINELYALSQGDVPAWVQQWEPTWEKADILFISTHPDDELIFFGGAIPTYAAERQNRVVVAYFTYANSTRSSELLNGLWHMGVRNYPVIGSYKDSYAKSLNDAYKGAGGKNKVNEWVVGLYRQYKPEVVVAQDLNGEYGHNQHKMTADAAKNCIALAADEDQFVDLTIAYGTWEVKKLYLHLYEENQITMDWETPLQSMGGSTGLELASEAMDLHKTQEGKASMEQGVEYDNHLFGLAWSTVGEDVEKNDFMENISTEPVVTATPAPTAPPAYMSVMPTLNEKGFLDEGEFIYSSEEQGLWIFVDQQYKIIIERKYDATQPLTWFEAEMWTDVASGALLQTIQNDPEKLGKVRADAMETAKKHHVVFATNTDYYTYRVGVNNGRGDGVVIRDGKILYNDPYDEKKGSNPDMFPNLDMLAFYPDGRMEVYHSWEKTAQELVDEGAYTVYSFGPYLIKDGVLSERAYKSNDNRNPRYALGMVEPGHYVAILCEGRLKRSQGVTIGYLAKLMRAKGCQVAMNLDGGQTCVFVFMGQQINKIGAYDGGKTNSRPTSEVLGVGFSDQVGTYELQ